MYFMLGGPRVTQFFLSRFHSGHSVRVGVEVSLFEGQ